MGKQRTPQGRSSGRRATPRTPASEAAKPLASVAPSVPEEALHPASVLSAPGLPEPAPEPLHAHLLDTVSPEALDTAAPEHATPAEAPVPADAMRAEAAPPEPRAEAPERAAAVADVQPPSPAPPAPAPQAAFTNVVPLKAAVPPRPSEPAVPGEAPVQLSDGALPAPASWRAGRRPVAPLRQDLEGMGETLFAFMRNESSAILTHLNALKDARTPADAIRLQVTEIQRAADASLTCWSEIARRATRIVAQR